MRQACEQLAPENVQAWILFRQLATRFLVDAGLAAHVFDRLTAEWSEAMVMDMLERLGIIYDVLAPPPERPTRGA